LQITGLVGAFNACGDGAIAVMLIVTSTIPRSWIRAIPFSGWLLAELLRACPRNYAATCSAARDA
jgi:hypothetical protein